MKGYELDIVTIDDFLNFFLSNSAAEESEEIGEQLEERVRSRKSFFSK